MSNNGNSQASIVVKTGTYSTSVCAVSNFNFEGIKTQRPFWVIYNFISKVSRA